MVYAGAIGILFIGVWWLLYLLRKETLKRGRLEIENENLQKSNSLQNHRLDIASRASDNPSDIIKWLRNRPGK